jgi:hypothetical protein
VQKLNSVRLELMGYAKACKPEAGRDPPGTPDGER